MLALVGIFMGCILDAMIKHLGASYSVILVAFMRYLFGTLIAGTAVIALRKKLPNAKGIRAHAIRAIALTGSATLFFYSLQKLPIAEATVLIFCAPLMVAPLGRWILKEKLRPFAMAGLVLGFIGVIIAVQGTPPGAETTERLYGILAGVSASTLYALSIVLLRQLAQKDDVLVTAFFGNIFPALYLLIPTLILGGAPRLADIPAFAFTGLAGFTLWFMLTHAYSRAPVQRLAATEYTALIWSALLGYFFFSEVPRIQLWIGAVLVVLAVMVAAWDGKRADLPPAPG
ncbi:MAG TPA: DMT family transporter [Hyphomonadaceae bacterium]|jgi:S-adenosylmethionine uptake transporter|nr:DMT family transporter [Hyphomonadaceae bacterium]